jgi:S1-C subfamily serine protease
MIQRVLAKQPIPPQARRLIWPLSGLLAFAVLLIGVLILPSLGGNRTATPPPRSPIAAPPSSTATTRREVTCTTWSRNWRDYCESLELAAPPTEPPAPSTSIVPTTVPTTSITSASAPTTPTTPIEPPLSGDWVPVVAKASPAVVKVVVPGGSGSGFLVDSKGHVVTNRHVAVEGPPYRVKTNGGRTLTARLVGMSSRYDIAVLRVRGLHASPLKWSGTKPKIGQAVLVLGFPGGDDVGVAFSATQGIVSALGRDFEDHPLLNDMVQYDAPTNHGNSGGPVLDRDGKVVAVHAAGEPDQHDMNFGILGTNAQKAVKRVLS